MTLSMRTQQPPPSIRYQYALIPIDAMLSAGWQSPEVERRQRQDDRRSQLLLLAIGALILVVACVAVAMVLAQLFRVGSGLIV